MSTGWERVLAAKELLGLGDRATLREIKAAYRRKSKQFHPDTDRSGADERACNAAMHEINEAYEILLAFCDSYSFSLTPDSEDQPFDAEEWWMDRFGQDPLWGKG